MDSESYIELGRIFKEALLQGINDAQKEATVVKISYNGFTGELVKLERHVIPCYPHGAIESEYSLSIYDSEKQVTHSFTGVKIEDVKFLGGTVAFGLCSQ